MLRAILLLISVLVSVGLIYAIGVWVLFGLFALLLATLLLSTRAVPEVVRARGADDAAEQSTMSARF